MPVNQLLPPDPILPIERPEQSWAPRRRPQAPTSAADAYPQSIVSAVTGRFRFEFMPGPGQIPDHNTMVIPVLGGDLLAGAGDDRSQIRDASSQVRDTKSSLFPDDPFLPERHWQPAATVGCDVGRR